ncbi:MAG: monovalent cation:proton antiporter-2 (CPA2) family protein [Rhodobacteraceae bacterium]|nr:monovalent cation:proton antiporter-2 (CPA2) family protein [Paracoccaceae bacterium]
MEGFLFQATIYLAAAVVAVPLAMRLGLGSVLGYLLAGIAIGPGLGLIGSEAEDLRHFAELGVVLMLFLIGLELEPRALWDMRERLVGLGGLQIGLTALAVAAAAMALSLPWQTALAVGLILSLSSTAIVLQTMTEKKVMHTAGGRSAFSVLLTQDIAGIPMLALLPLLATAPGAGRPAPAADHGEALGPALTWLQELPAWGVTLVTLAAVVLIVAGGHYLTRPVFRYIHAARLREINTAVSLLFVVGVAELMILVGLSPALGTFLAGVVLANSEFRHELEADIEPFKGLLLGLFFITVGAGMDFALLLERPVTVAGLALGLMALKGVVLHALARLFRLKGRDNWLFTLGLAQAGEFGFVLITFSESQRVLTLAQAQLLLLVVALSMLMTPLFFIAWEQISRRLAEAGGPGAAHDRIDDQQPVIIAGVGRFGQVVNRLVQSAGLKTTVLDNDLETIQTMRAFGFKGFFGDPTRPELLHAAGLRTAKVLVVALDDRDAAVRLVTYARRERPDLHIIARAYDRVHVYRLYRAGANDIVREMFDSSLRAGRYVLENMGFSEYEAAELERTFFRIDRAALKELAELWRPDIPIDQNQPYLERSKELNRELENALLRQIEKNRRPSDAA